MLFDEIWLPSLLLIRYELRHIKQEKLKRMAMEDEKSSVNNSYEVEMAEAKDISFVEPLPPSEWKLWYLLMEWIEQVLNY